MEELLRNGVLCWGRPEILQRGSKAGIIRIDEVSGDGSRRCLRINGKKGISFCKEDFTCTAVTVRLA
jgi:hypothetical protein